MFILSQSLLLVATFVDFASCLREATNKWNFWFPLSGFVFNDWSKCQHRPESSRGPSPASTPLFFNYRLLSLYMMALRSVSWSSLSMLLLRLNKFTRWGLIHSKSSSFVLEIAQILHINIYLSLFLRPGCIWTSQKIKHDPCRKNTSCLFFVSRLVNFKTFLTCWTVLQKTSWFRLKLSHLLCVTAFSQFDRAGMWL